MPFGESVFETSCRTTASAKQPDRVIGIHAVRAAAVRNDLDACGQRLDVGVELVDRDRPCPGDVAGRELGGWPHIDDHDFARRDPFDELFSTDLFESAPIPQIGGSEIVELVEMHGSDVPQRRPQLANPLRSEPVVDPGAVTARRHQSGRCEYSEMERRVGDGLADLRRKLVDVTLPLREHVDQLRPAPVGERLGHLAERVEQRVLRLPITHRSSAPPSRHALDTIQRTA